MSTPPKFRVAICGGGIGGLTFAIALTSYTGIEIDIYESAAQFEDIGAGIGIWGRGIGVLRKLGLEERTRAIATAPPGKHEGITLELIRADQPSKGELFGHLAMSTNFGFHRSQLIDLLAKILCETGRARTHFRKRCVSFTQREGCLDGHDLDENAVTVHFADGTSAACDVLIGCDGIRSAVRGELMRDSTERPTKGDDASAKRRRYFHTRFSGTVAYRALVKPEDLRAIAGEHSAITVRKMYCGKDRHIVTYPVGGGRFLNFLAYSSDPKRQEEWANGPWVVEADQQELLDQYPMFSKEVQNILQCIDKSSRWAMYDIEPLQFWSKGHVTILGDAAHAMTPFIGAGGGQVLEDAYILSRLLGSPIATRATLPSVLLAYERVRMSRANGVITSSREARQAFEYMGKYEGATNKEVAEALHRVSDWLFEERGDPDDDVQEAERLVLESLKINVQD